MGQKIYINYFPKPPEPNPFGYGHAIGAERINGEVYILDPMKGVINAIDSLDRMESLRYFRIDDKLLNPNIDWKLIMENKK